MKVLFRAICTLVMIMSCAFPVYAETTAVINVVMTPDYTTGINGFTITYVSETNIQLDWSLASGISNIMIRAKYGEYPDDIPNESTQPSDGYLVYYGSGTTINDTSMNFDDNPGALYYKAWAQRDDTTWVVDTSTSEGWMESEIMTLLFFGVAAGILTYVAVRSSYWILKFLAGIAWWGVAAYWNSNLPSAITEGAPEDTIMLMLFIFTGIAIMLMPFWYTRRDKDVETGVGFKLPFQKTPDEIERNRKPNRGERNDEYTDRVNASLNGTRRPRRY